MSPQEQYDQRILQAIASGQRVTQRSLAGELGVALGLTNLLVRRLAGKGYIKISGMGTRHVRYLMTPAGWEALGRATRMSLENTIRLYTQTREQIRERLCAVVPLCAVDGSGRKPVLFYGAGDVAEIAFVSLQHTDLTLVGVVDDHRRGRFFNLTISAPDRLSADGLEGIEYSHVIITSVRHSDAIQARIAQRGIPADRVWAL